MSHILTIELSDRAYGLLLLSDRPLAEALEEAILSHYAGEMPPALQARWQPVLEAMVQQAVQTALQQAPSSIPATTAPEPPVYPPRIHPLAVGDRVQIQDSNSPYYRAIVPITAVGIIRATVRTEQGEQSFLKRDLRYIPPADLP